MVWWTVLIPVCCMAWRCVVHRNRLRELPDLSRLTALTFLDASFNALSAVPRLPTSGALAQIFLGNNALRNLDGLTEVGISAIGFASAFAAFAHSAPLVGL